MIKRFTTVLFVTGWLLIAAPVFAAERVDTIPEPKFSATGRSDYVFAINKVVIGYGKAEFAPCASGQDCAHTVSVDLRGNQVTETIAVGSTEYVRQNNERRWKTRTPQPPFEGFFPELPLADDLHYRIGDIEINGVLTTQYQLQVSPARLPAGLTAANLNLFLARSDNTVYKTQVTTLGADPKLGTLEIESVVVFKDHNQPVVIGPPPAGLVDAASAHAFTDEAFAGGQFLPSWAAPLFVRELAHLRASR